MYNKLNQFTLKHYKKILREPQQQWLEKELAGENQDNSKQLNNYYRKEIREQILKAYNDSVFSKMTFDMYLDKIDTLDTEEDLLQYTKDFIKEFKDELNINTIIYGGYVDDDYIAQLITLDINRRSTTKFIEGIYLYKKICRLI